MWWSRFCKHAARRAQEDERVLAAQRLLHQSSVPLSNESLSPTCRTLMTTYGLIEFRLRRHETTCLELHAGAVRPPGGIKSGRSTGECTSPRASPQSGVGLLEGTCRQTKVLEGWGDVPPCPVICGLVEECVSLFVLYCRHDKSLRGRISMPFFAVIFCVYVCVLNYWGGLFAWM